MMVLPMNKRKFPLYYAAFVASLFLCALVALSPVTPKRKPMSQMSAYEYFSTQNQRPEPLSDSWMLFIVLGIAFGYILPSVIAVCRNNPNAIPIVILNLALGWTFLGWLASLMWSFASTPESRARSLG